MTDDGKNGGLTLANKITIVRILSVPFFVLMLIYYTMGLKNGHARELHRMTALVVFCAVALTDALDGYIARSRHQITPLGKVLDPLADKALLLSGLILLTRPSIEALEPHIPVWFTLLVISRDVVIVLGATLVHAVAGAVTVKPRVVGKISTFFQMVAIIWVLVGGAQRPFYVWIVAAGFFTLSSFVMYLYDGMRQLEKSAAARREGDSQ